MGNNLARGQGGARCASFVRPASAALGGGADEAASVVRRQAATSMWDSGTVGHCDVVVPFGADSIVHVGECAHEVCLFVLFATNVID
jgi:hypothetical protein